MKKLTTLFLLALLSVNSAWADVAINETNFPDMDFRNWILSQSYGTDGILTDKEIAGVTSINVANNYVKNMQGIEFFTALTNLNCSYNQLTSLDVSKNTALTILNCNGNGITSLDLHNCTALKTLECDDNELKSLDLHEFTALEKLVCSRNKLTVLDLSNNTALTTLDCYANYLSALDLSNNTALITLKCTSYGQLSSLDLSRNTALTELYCNNTGTLKTLNVSGCTKLMKLDCANCSLQQLDVSGCVSLTDLWCNENILRTLNVSGCVKLGLLQCNNNYLQQLDVSGCRALEYLYAQDNVLTSLNVAECVSLNRVHIYRNQIKGKEMDCLVRDLPQISAGRGDLVMSRPNTGAGDTGHEWNEMTTVQVAVAKAKGWRPAYQGWDGFPGNEYEGTGGAGETVYLETDVTSQFPTDWQGWNGATGYTATDFAPMVTTNDGRNVQVCEKYDGNSAATGEVFYRTLTGLPNGTYRIELYGAASSTKGRDTSINSDMTASNEGDETAVYLYATTSSGTVKQYIPVHWATSFSEVSTAVLNDVEVTDGEVTIGMYSDKPYTNWHVVQIKGVTATADALTIYAKALANAQTALATYVNVTGIERETLSQAIIDNTLTGEQSAEVYQASINALESATKTFLEAKDAYDMWLSVKDNLATRNYPYASAEKKAAAEAALSRVPTNAAQIEEIMVLFRKYAESSAMLEGVNGATDMTSYIKNPKAESTIVDSEWRTVYGKDSGGSIGILDNQPWTDGSGNTAHKYFDGGNWESSAWDVTLQQEITLPAGKYQLTAIGRSASDVELTLFAGDKTANMAHNNDIGGLFNRGWEQTSVEFELADESTVKIGVRGVTNVIHNWMSFSDFRLVKFPETIIETGIAINETNFPDENFRNWLSAQEYGSDSKLSEAEIAGITSMDVQRLDIKNMQGIEFFTALTGLDCSSNQLTSLDVSKNTALTSLDCSSNQLTALDVSKNTALTGLNCNFNQLTALDVSNNTALTDLWCSSNQLTSLDVSKNIALKVLLCSNNQLTALNVSGCIALTGLGCSSNQLTSLDVSECIALTELHCSDNQIKGAAMDAFVESLPTVSSGSLYVIAKENEQNVMTTTQVAAAKAKGWIAYLGDDFEGWGEYQGPKCATPTIAFVDGKLQLDCDTEDAVIVSKVTCADAGEYEGTLIPFATTYNITTYAKKDGYIDSDVATKEINVGGTGGGVRGDVNQDGDVNVGDMVVISNIMSGNE